MTTPVKEQIRDLNALRFVHGANSDVGGLCSNRIEQARNYETATEPRQREALERFMADTERYLALALVGA